MLDRNTEESADDSNCNEGIVGNLANKEDTKGDDLFQKSNNPTLSARKSEFCKEVNQRMDNIAQENDPTSIMTDEYFEDILRFLLSLQTVDDKKRIRIMRSYPNKIAYKWVKRYGIVVIDSRNVIIYKQ